MTGEGKRLKIMCLVSLFLGVIEIVCGLVLPVELGVSIIAQMSALACGILSVLLGIHGARAANVPSNAKGIRSFAIVISLLSCALFGLAIYKGRGFTYFSAICLVGFIADLLIVIFAHLLQRSIERV
jgi:hypothetical protein